MAAKQPPAFQFYAADFLDGTRTMSNAEVGAYIRLLAHSWGNGPLPLEELRIARIIQATVRELRALWPAVGAKWRSTGSGWINARLEHQRTKLAEFTEHQSAKGKAGAKKRWHGHSNGHTSGHTPATAQAQAESSPSDGSSVFSLRSSKPARKEHSQRRAHATVTPEGFETFWNAYPKGRRQKRPDAEAAWRKLDPNERTQAAILSALEWQCRLVDWRKENNRFAPMAASYLNSRRWEDEPFDPVDPMSANDEAWDTLDRGDE